MNKNEIEVKLIALTQKAKSEKLSLIERIRELKAEVRKQNANLQTSLDRLAEIRENAIKDIKENIEQIVAQQQERHRQSIDTLNESLARLRTTYDTVENNYLSEKRELLQEMIQQEKEEQTVKPVF
jgi:hypothetical protein